MKAGKVVLILLSLLLLARLVAIGWSLDKGIDITDESCYLLSYHYPETDTYQQTDYNLVVNMWFGWTGLGLVTIRVLRFLLEMLSLLSLIWGVHGFLIKRNGGVAEQQPSFLLLLLFGACGLFLSLFSRGLYYDHLSMFCVFTSVGFTLKAVSVARGQVIWILLSGFMCGWLWMIKFPTAILLTCMSFLLLMLLSPGKKGLRKVLSCLLFPAGSLLPVFAFLSWLGQTPAEYADDFLKGQEVYRLLGYDPMELLTRIYIPDLLETLRVILPALAVFAGWLLIRRNKYGEAFLVSFPAMVGLLLLFNHPAYEYLTLKSQPSILIQSSYLYHWLVGCLLLVILLQRKTLFTGERKMFPFLSLAALLWLLPYCIMLGTDTVFTVSQYTYLAAWFPLILLLGYTAKPVLGKGVFTASMAGTVLLGAAHFFGFYLFAPYRMHDSLFAQTESVEGPYETFLMDHESASMVKDTRRILESKGFRTGYPVLAVGDLPGLVYLLGGEPAGTYWFFSEDASASYNCNFINHVKSRKGMPIVLVEERVSPGTKECIEAFLMEKKAAPVGEAWNVYGGSKIVIYDN